MKAFGLKILVFALLLSGTYYVMIDKLSTGYVDIYYNKCTEEAGSLFIGISRAQQGLSPEVFKKQLNTKGFDEPMINFAFNSYESPYGEAYLDAIKKKLKPNTNNGLFILSVTPGSFVDFFTNEKDIQKMEKKSIVGKVTDFTSNPNYNYIMKCYGFALYNIFGEDYKWENLTTHSNGWNEVKIKNGPQKLSEEEMEAWALETIYSNKKREKTERISTYRINSFVKTIDYLKQRGSVYIVRLPADPRLIELENNYWKGFNKEMDSISQSNGVSYLNYSIGSENFKSYDGSHLTSESAKKVSELISKDILNKEPVF